MVAWRLRQTFPESLSLFCFKSQSLPNVGSEDKGRNACCVSLGAAHNCTAEEKKRIFSPISQPWRTAAALEVLGHSRDSSFRVPKHSGAAGRMQPTSPGGTQNVTQAGHGGSLQAGRAPWCSTASAPSHPGMEGCSFASLLPPPPGKAV